MSERIEERNKSLAAGMTAMQARRKREETTIKLRKQKKDERMWAKRNRVLAEEPKSDVSSANPMSQVPSDLQSLAQLVQSPDVNTVLEAVTQFRKLLSVEHSPPIKDVIATGVIPRFVECLQRADTPQLQFEAAWALTNIASGTSEDTQVVIDNNAVPVFVQLLSSPSFDVREQAVWALGNLAGDSAHFRDLVLGCGAMAPMTHLINSEASKISILRNATWALSNLCRGKPQPDFAVVSAALPTLARLIYANDEEVLTDACWALSYLSDGSNDKIQAVLDAGVCGRLVELLMHASPTVQTPALRAVGNIVTGEEEQTQAVINASALPCLLNLLSHSKRGIRKEACWAISNITAGTEAQIQATIEANIMPPLIGMLSNGEFEIRKEACWAVSNATSGGSPAQIAYMVERGCIRPLSDLLVAQEPRVLTVALDALENVLKTGELICDQQNLEANPYTEFLEAAEGLDKIEALQNHANKQIYEKARDILETYCDASEFEDEQVAPQVDEQGQFQFGAVEPAAMQAGGFQFN